MSKKIARRVLGRGLSSLIPTAEPQEINAENEIVFVAMATIKPNPFQPRTEFDEDEIKSLAESIEKQGLLQPILLRQKEINEFEIISGERRFRALKSLGRDKIPAVIKQRVTDREMMEIALVENIQREELNEIEKAVGYQKLLLECNYTHEQLSQQLGKSRTVITNTLRLLNLPDEIQVMVKKNQISMGHARALLSVEENSKRLTLAQKIVTENLSVREIEKQTAQESSSSSKKQKKPQAPAKIDPDFAEAISRLQYKFGTSVTIATGSKNKGSISIEYFSDEDCTRIINILLSENR